MAKRLRFITVVTVVLGVGLIGAARVIAESPQERAQVQVANRASERFDRAMDTFVLTAAKDISAKQVKAKTDYPALKAFVDKRIVNAPKIQVAGTNAYGRQHSKHYRSAAERRKLALTPFRRLSGDLEDTAIPDQAFVDAGKKLVQINPAKILANIYIYSGTPLRTLVVPAFEKARDRLKNTRAPTDSALLQLDLMTYAKDSISQTKDGATKLDMQQPFVFNFGTRPDDLLRRLVVVQSTIRTEVGNDVDVLKLPK